MDLLHTLLLAIVQGLTEFLPISSSGHLILLPYVVGWRDQGLAADVAAHFGTLLAVIYYFKRELKEMAVAWWGSVFHRRSSAESSLAWAVLWGTVPLALSGLLLYDLVQTLREPLLIAATTAGFGILLWVSDKTGRRTLSEYQIGWRHVLVIALAQALALIPGTSRSGITMTAALGAGLTRSAAARFSFLLSVPAIALASGYQTLKLIQSAEPVNWGTLASIVLLSAISAYICIDLFLKFLEKTGMAPFAVYRVLLAGVIYLVFA